MKTKSILAALLLMVVGLQTLFAQERAMKIWRNGHFSGYVVSKVDSIQFVILATEVVLSQSEVALEIGEGVQLTATVHPEEASQLLKWSSSNPQIAEVGDDGWVKALANGSCVIRCSAVDGIDVYAECLVKVGSTGDAAITCAEAVLLANTMADGATSNETYTISGYITEVVGNVSRNQQTFWMDDTKDGGKLFEAYWANLPEGVAEFQAGMRVQITGPLTKYVNKSGEVIPEIKNATVVILDDGSGTDIPSGGAKGSGTETDPYNAIAAIQFAQSLGADVESENEVYVTGIISSIKYTYSSSYGTATYNISADGKTENQFTVYGSYYLNNQPWQDGDTQIQVGDEVLVCGKVINYKGNTPEFVNKKNWLVSIKSGGVEPGGDEPVDDPVTNLLNGGFEEWVSETEPMGWKSACSASSAVLSQSTDARSGDYACVVATGGTMNKRLATQEITLEAGSYTFSFYAQSTTGDVCQTRGGYVPVNADGNVGAYKYGDFVNISNTDWTLVTYDFELTQQTTVCLLVMNPKNSQYSIAQDILVDDAMLEKK